MSNPQASQSGTENQPVSFPTEEAISGVGDCIGLKVGGSAEDTGRGENMKTAMFWRREHTCLIEIIDRIIKIVGWYRIGITLIVLRPVDGISKGLSLTSVNMMNLSKALTTGLKGIMNNWHAAGWHIVTSTGRAIDHGFARLPNLVNLQPGWTSVKDRCLPVSYKIRMPTLLDHRYNII
jgi:hypothetical protein